MLVGSFILRLRLFVDFGPGTLTTLLPKSLMRKSPEILSVHYTKKNSSEREKKKNYKCKLKQNGKSLRHRYNERKRYKHKTKAHSCSYLLFSQLGPKQLCARLSIALLFHVEKKYTNWVQCSNKSPFIKGL